jgi:hypothetical protein
LNAFVAGDAGAIGEVLLGPLGEPALDDANGVFRERAAADMRLDWDRQKTGAPATQHAFAQVCLTHICPQLGPGTLASG